MFKHVNAITVCVDVYYAIEMEHFVEHNINTIGVQEVYMDCEKVYVGFSTKSTIPEVERALKEYLYKVDTKVVGGTIFATFR